MGPYLEAFIGSGVRALLNWAAGALGVAVAADKIDATAGVIGAVLAAGVSLALSALSNKKKLQTPPPQ